MGVGFLCLQTALAAQEVRVSSELKTGTALAMENRAYLKDNRIIVETPEGDKAVDFTMDRGHRVYRLKNYTVKEEVNVVDEALKVFERKSPPVYSKKVWIYDQVEDRSQAYVEFMTNEFNEDIVFSPGEEFVYYLEYTPEGEHRLYGIKIGTEEKFFINTAEDFFIETCEDKDTSYVIVAEDGQVDSYHVFDLEGSKVQFIEKLDNIEDLKNVICY